MATAPSFSIDINTDSKASNLIVEKYILSKIAQIVRGAITPENGDSRRHWTVLVQSNLQIISNSEKRNIVLFKSKVGQHLSTWHFTL